MLIVGKQNLVKIMENLLNTNNIKKIFLNGIMDKDLISLIKEKTVDVGKELDFRVIVPNIQNRNLINAYRFLASGEIRTNTKCRSKFILIDNNLFYLSGNSKDTSYLIEDKDFIIKLEENEAIHDLEKIFLKNWDNGMPLYIKKKEKNLNEGYDNWCRKIRL